MVAALAAAGCGGSDDEQRAVAVPAVEAADEQAPDKAASAEAAPVVVAPRAPDPALNGRILLQEATDLERNGFWEEAATLRAAVLNGDAADLLGADATASARIDQVRLLLRLGRYAEAEARLLQARSAGTGEEGRLVLDLLEGRVLSEFGELDAAADALQRYIDGGGAAPHSALLLRADIAADLSDIETALAQYSAVADDPSAGALDIETALLQSGLLLENQGRYEEAGERYQQLYDVSPWVSDDSFAQHRIGVVALAQGDVGGAREAWQTLLSEFPWHRRAALAYEAASTSGIQFDPLVEGLFLYRQFRLSDAEELYAEFVDGDPADRQAAVATYYWAAMAEDLGQEEDAIEGYLAAVELDPTGPLADNALWWAARLREDRGELSLATSLYARLATVHPARDFGREAAFRAGLLPYLRGDLEQAERTFVVLAGASADRVLAQRAWLWTGKTRELLGDLEGAQSAYRRATRPDGLTYYGLRAAALLASEPLAPRLADSALGATDAPDSGETEAWLREIVGDEPESASQALEESVAWRAGLELYRAGFGARADSSFRSHLAEAADDPWTLYRSGQALGALGLVHLRLEAATALLTSVGPASPSAQPAEILRWAYPRGWPTLAEREAREHDVDELLLYAMIRQESRFNPAAGSIAGALGLTQVIPPTAEEIAAAIGDEAFEISLLFRPERSIRYGAFYLGDQLANFDGAPWIALAAYNGGPGNAARWAGSDTRIDPDLFYERITFSETRAYVRLVLENYAWYQFIYRGTDGPTLLSGSAAVSDSTSPAAERSG